ncbi:MAG: hypothetical protein O7E54_10005, partial [Planctomycetota bacterium]|nr:hypothetical protein [Planctomycetota bacterium]
MNRRHVVLAALLAAVTSPATASATGADILLLKDGRFVEGRKMEQKEGHVVVHFPSGMVEVRDELVDQVLFEGSDEFVPRTDEEKQRYAAGLVPWQGKWVKPAVRKKRLERLIAEKRAEIEEALAHSKWANRYQEETSNFLWHYTVPAHVGEYFKVRTEAYYDKVCKDWKVKRDKKKRQKMPMNCYTNIREFNRTSGGRGALAYFMFLRNYDLNFFYDRLDID